MKKDLILVLVVVGVMVFGSFILNKNKKTYTFKIGETIMRVGIANTDEERLKGLSGKESLKEGEGLLFIFETEGLYGFWMKDMKFAIDIAWIDKDNKIIYIENDVRPETYPKVFQPLLQSLYVLEAPSGFLSKNNIKIGDFVAF